MTGLSVITGAIQKYNQGKGIRCGRAAPWVKIELNVHGIPSLYTIVKALKVQVYLIVLCFVLFHFTDVALFTNGRKARPAPQQTDYDMNYCDGLKRNPRHL